ncbi:MAG TPA: response regulator, partial [Syntrophorhabdaceae bacterium]|nr:response regulator [Syntrophorhabdaceae bacterium]
MNTRKQTVLIVDDEPTNIEILNRALGTDYEILAVTSGKEALEIAAHQSPDLIVLDIIMPVMSGYEVLQNLKQSASLKEIPVVFITALDREDRETRGLELGA